jgi:O-antigen/teichoic acid export membrane protein
MNMDKFSIIKYFGKAELGYYSIASMLANYLYLLPNLIYAVLFPRFYESFGRAGDIKKLRHYLESPTLIISYFISGITAYMTLFLPFLMKYILPSYTPGIACAKILLFGMFFVSLQGMSSYILVVMNRQRLMILLSLFGISLAAFFNHIFVNVLGWNIEGVATAMAATYFIYTTVFISNAFKYHSSKPSDLLAFLAKIYAPFIWLIAVTAVLGLASPCSGASLKSDLLTLSAKGAILALSYIPMLYYLNKTTGIMNKIFKMVRSGFRARK